jgi:hypothetical protein
MYILTLQSEPELLSRNCFIEFTPGLLPDQRLHLLYRHLCRHAGHHHSKVAIFDIGEDCYGWEAIV